MSKNNQYLVDISSLTVIKLTKIDQNLGVILLKSLFGSKSAERILLFLWVNEQCYASQIQNAYGIALTPIQNVLRKFEQAGILVSSFKFDPSNRSKQTQEGNFVLSRTQESPISMNSLKAKKKLYRFNPNYAFIAELKAILQKGFALLPAEEKKYLFVRQELRTHRLHSHQKRQALCLQAFLERLMQVQQMTIRAQAGDEALGEVKVKLEKPGILTFTERGRWVKGDRKNIDFHNSLRWSFVFEEGIVMLEHLRHGPNHPIFLSYLKPIRSSCFQSTDPHLCQGDCYFGTIEFNRQGIYLTWRILSDGNNEILHYVYI